MTDLAISRPARVGERAPTRLVRLRERARTTGLVLDPSEVGLLRAANAGLKVVATGVEGRYDVEASQWVGSIVGRSLRVLIEPKIAIRRVLYLMGFHPGGVRLGVAASFDVDDDLLDAMQVVYTAALDRALEGGLVRDYQRHDELLVAPRGRIDVMSLVAHRYGVFPPIACAFDEHTADTEANRRLLAAALRLLRVVPTGHSAPRLRLLVEQFHEVSLVSFGSRGLRPLVTNRRSARYAQALTLAELVLRNASIELRDGETSAVGFLVDMDLTYERFVVDALRAELKLDTRTWVHHPKGLSLDEASAVTIAPDAVWYSAQGRPQLVVDAKYKVSEQGLGADLYQMLAYTTALGLPRGVLVYADATEHVHRIRRAGVEVHVVSLDPNGEPDEVRARVKELAERLRTAAERSAV